MAICANPEFDYVYVSKDGETYILAENLMEDVLGKQVKIHRTKIPAESEDEEDKIIEEKEVMYDIIKTVKGEDLIGMSYDYILLDEVPKHAEFDEIESVHKVLPGDHVELGEGTGLVHTTYGTRSGRL